MKLVVVFATLVCLFTFVSCSPTVNKYRETRKQQVKNILSEHNLNNCYHSWIGDKSCDKACDNKENNFDGGDCLPHFQQVHSTEKMKESFDVQVIGFTTSELTRVEHHVYDVPYTTVRRLQKFQLEPRDNNPRFKIVEMWVSTRYEKCKLKVHQDGNGNLFVDAIPANIAIGVNEVLFVTSENDKIDGGQIVVLLNPWSETSPVYMKPHKGTDYLEEFILGLDGQSYYGDAANGHASVGLKRNYFGTKAWGYHHDDIAVHEVVLRLLNVLGSLDRKDPRKIARHFSKVLSATWTGAGYSGVLTGRWDGKYSDGQKPTSWTGSRGIYREYLNNGMRSPVKYGQCWVFGGILTTALRYLGVPSRIVVNFRSAHDTKGKNGKFDGVIIAKKESVWNFHVWVDAWMRREDIVMEGYDTSILVGWNAVDATPQEKSEGEFQMGPAFIPFIKTNFALDAENNYDAKFVAAEVNSVHRFPKMDYRQDVGRSMLTKKAFSFSPVDVIKRYKKCKSMFFAVVNKGKDCGFFIANGKVGYLYDDHKVGEPEKQYWSHGGVKIWVLALTSKTKAQVCNAEACQTHKGVLNLNNIYETKEETPTSFLETETTKFFWGKKKKEEETKEDEAETVAEEEKISETPKSTKHMFEQQEEPEDEPEDGDHVQEDGSEKKEGGGLLRGMKNMAKRMYKKGKDGAKRVYEKTKSVVKKAYAGVKKFIISVVTSLNPLKRLSRKEFLKDKELCLGCFHIVKAHKKSFVKNPLMISVKRNVKHLKDTAFEVKVLFEIISNNGEDVELGAPFYRETVKFPKGLESKTITIKPKKFHKHLDKAMTVRVTLRAVSLDKKYVDFDQESFQLYLPRLNVENVKSEHNVLSMDVSVKNPLHIPLKNVVLAIDDPYGDRTIKVSGLSVHGVHKQSIKVPIVKKKKGGRPIKQHCVIVNAYADELFAMSGWENTVCYDDTKGSKKITNLKVLVKKWISERKRKKSKAGINQK